MCETLEMFFIFYWMASMNSTWLGPVWFGCWCKLKAWWNGEAVELLFCGFMMTAHTTLYINYMTVWTSKWQPLHRMSVLELVTAMRTYYDI